MGNELRKHGSSKIHDPLLPPVEASPTFKSRQAKTAPNVLFHNMFRLALQSLAGQRCLEIPSRPAYSFTTCQTTFSVTPVPQTVPFLQTHRNNLPCFKSAALNQWSRISFTQSGIGTVRTCAAFPTKST